MKKTIALIGILSASAVAASAQNQSNQQNQTCRDISAGGFIAPDEVIMQTQSGYVACRVFKPLAATKNEAAPTPAPAPTVAVGPNPAPAPASAPVPAAMAPMGKLASRRGDETFPRVQGGAGYQYASFKLSGNVNSVLSASSDRFGFNGMFGQGNVNLSRYVSVVGEGDFERTSLSGKPLHIVGTLIGQSGAVVVQGPTGHINVSSFTGGPQVYPMGHGRWEPFGRATIGLNRAAWDGASVTSSGNVQHYNGSKSGLSWQIGGGLNYRLRRHLGVRLFQFDYSRVTADAILHPSGDLGAPIPTHFVLTSVKFGAGITF
jgi:hypothetical protein